MLSSLIHTALAEDDPMSDDEPEVPIVELDSDSDDAPPPPAPSRNYLITSKPTQSRLSGADGRLAQVTQKGKGKATQGRNKFSAATLVVAPMSLLAQWVTELERSSKDGMEVLLYYGSDRGQVKEHVDGGVQVVVSLVPSSVLRDLFTTF